MQGLKDLYALYAGNEPEFIHPVSGAGSNRKYYRLGNNKQTVIGVVGTFIPENMAFVSMATHFFHKGLPVPQLLAHNEDMTRYLQEDVGDVSLFDSIQQGRETGVFSAREKEKITQVIKMLPYFQVRAADDFDFSVCYPQPEFDERLIGWDLNYFKYCFLKNSGLEFNENLLENDFQVLTEKLLSETETAFMYRDFQSRNVMLKDGKPYFIDFQGGRKGPVAYDLASFLWQAKAHFPAKLRDELVEVYLQELNKIIPVDVDALKSKLPLFAVLRTLQVLGAYGFRGLVEKKLHFIESIPSALDNLRHLLAYLPEDVSYLKDLLSKVTTLDKFKLPKPTDQLTVTVVSFSYKKGIPEDESNHGGGFVFDCRAIHNPGRYEAYKNSTGLDSNVQTFLENDGEMRSFLTHAYALVDAAVERYIARGFTDLMVSFGCTGGQHRSVYAAQHTAEHIRDKFGTTVRLIHREQNISGVFEPQLSPAK